MPALLDRFRSRRAADDRTRASGGRRAAAGARAVRHAVARLIGLLTTLVVVLIVLAIVLVLLKANPDNGLVDAVLEGARVLAGPFDAIFELERRRTEIAVNWGIAAVVYGIVGGFVARVVRG